ncbi:MAG: hypothetical protein IKD44_05155 [Lentisphaeria bacterium]|nr:hypothetical protein [Lentisphaeria bacterium]
MAEFISQCPHCQSDLQLQDDYTGMAVKCPVCSKSFYVCKNATPTPKKSALGNGAPKEAAQPEQFARVNDNEEDNFVLEYLKLCKIVWTIIFVLGCFGLVILAIGSGVAASADSDDDKFWLGIGFLFCIIPWCVIYLFVMVILCWLRGIYINTIKLLEKKQ